jgi:2-hydroxychromene-2-carboxylate isomerase
MTAPLKIDFYLDFISPFGYLARPRLIAIAEKYGAQISYRAVDLQQLKRAAGNTGPSNRDIPPKLAYLTEDIQRWAKRYGVTAVRTLPGPNTSRLNRGLLFARNPDEARDYVRHAWDCVWRDGRDPGLAETVAELAERMGWRQGDLVAFIDSSSTQERYSWESAAAVQRGVFGVPTIMVGEHMWWGNDRLDFVEEYLEKYRVPDGV